MTLRSDRIIAAARAANLSEIDTLLAHRAALRYPQVAAAINAVPPHLRKEVRVTVYSSGIRIVLYRPHVRSLKSKPLVALLERVINALPGWEASTDSFASDKYASCEYAFRTSIKVHFDHLPRDTADRFRKCYGSFSSEWETPVTFVIGVTVNPNSKTCRPVCVGEEVRTVIDRKYEIRCK